jgi:hypothetical protein
MSKQQFWRNASKAAFDSDLIATRMTLAMAELLWAVMLFWPGDTFARPTYEIMGELSPEIAWACAFLFSGIVQAKLALSANRDTVFAHAFGVWNAGLWLVTVTAMLLAVYPPPAAIGGEIALALAAIWVAVRPFILAYLHRKCQGLLTKGCHAAN